MSSKIALKSLSIFMPVFLWSMTAPAKNTCSLKIISKPKGARIWIDGKERGVTPLKVKGLSPGLHLVVLNLSRYQRKEKLIKLKSRKTKTIQLKLKRKYGRLLVTAFKKSKIYLNSKSVGTTPKILKKVPIGEHDLKVVHGSLVPFEQKVHIREDETSFIQAKFQLKLKVTTAPSGARILLDGKSVGTSPLSIPVKEGTYTLAADLRKHQLKTQRITLSMSSANSVSLKLTPSARLWSRPFSESPSGEAMMGAGLAILPIRNKLVALELMNGRQRWKYIIQGGKATHVAISQGRVLTTIIGSRTGYLLALSAGTGKQLWIQQTPGRPVYKPLVKEGNLYFATDRGVAQALRIKNGAIVWKTIHKKMKMSFSPVFFKRQFIYGGEAGWVTALKQRGGSRNWTFRTGIQKTLGPLIAGDIVVARGGWSKTRSIIARDAYQGKPRWKFTIRGDWRLPLVLTNWILAADSMGGKRIIGVTIKKGHRLWAKDFAIPVSKLMAVGNIFIVVVGKEVFALAARTGKVKWQLNFPTLLKDVSSSGKYLVLASGPKVYVLDSNSGKKRLVFKTLGTPYYLSLWGGMAIALCKGTNRILYAIELPK